MHRKKAIQVTERVKCMSLRDNFINLVKNLWIDAYPHVNLPLPRQVHDVESTAKVKVERYFRDGVTRKQSKKTPKMQIMRTKLLHILDSVPAMCVLLGLVIAAVTVIAVAGSPSLVAWVVG